MSPFHRIEGQHLQPNLWQPKWGPEGIFNELIFIVLFLYDLEAFATRVALITIKSSTNWAFLRNYLVVIKNVKTLSSPNFYKLKQL